MATPEEIKALKDQITELNKQIDEAGGTAIDLGKAFAKAGGDADKLNKVLETVKKSLKDITDSSNYVFETFRDITAELKNQNLLLKIGNSSFKAFSDIAQNVNYYQKGNLDLTDKQIKKDYQTLDIKEKELKFVRDRLGNEEGVFFQESKIKSIQTEMFTADGKRKKILESRLEVLNKEKALYTNAHNTLIEGLPILKKELDLSKQIFTVRQDLGGIAINASKILTKFGGSLSQFLNLNEAVASAEEYNKKIVLGALNSEKVQNQLLEIEKEKVGIQKQLDTGRFKDEKTGKFIKATEEERIKRQKQLISLEEKAGKVKLNAVASTNTLVNKFKTLGVLTKEMGTGLVKALKDPVTLITFFGKAILNADEKVTNLGKSLGISKDQAYGIRNNFVEYSRYANDTFITTDRLLKAQSELSSQLGIAVQFSGKQAEDFARLTELSGLSADEAGRLAKFSIAAGQGIGEYTDNIREGAASAEQATNTHFDSREILKDVSKLSAGILIKFQGNPKALAAAVVQAKALGTNLETIDKIGESLLNFETSIENELKAELLTGRQLNLERARYAALTGNQLELTQAITKEVGSLADFSNMNVIAQQSLAQAFGLSKNELADMLLQQKVINDEGSEAAKLNTQQLKDFEKQKELRKELTLKEYLKEQEQQLTVQNKFNNAVLALQGFIGNLVDGPLGKFVDYLSKSLDTITGIAAGLATVYAISKTISIVEGITAALTMRKAIAQEGYAAWVAVSNGFLEKGLALQVANAAAWVIANPFLALGSLALAAGVGALVYSQTQSVKDGIAPSSKGPFTITDDYGKTAVTAKGDNIVVSPNVIKESINKPTQPSFDTSAITDAISALSNTVSGLINRQQPTPQFALHVDGKQLGTVVGKQMETGTSQNIYTGYKIA
jgi:hypothetical protein